jgi:hypothetical protein
MKSAVLFLTYRRFETAEKVFESIRQARPLRLYFASNGSNSKNVGEDERVKEVRALVDRIDWPCELHTLFRDEHLSVKYSITSSIDWFFETEEMGIILEDDCLPSDSFYPFCDELLEKYKDDERIGFITAMNYLEKTGGSESYFFSEYPAIWGWATWKKVWLNYDLDMRGLDVLLSSDEFIKSFDDFREYKYWAKWFAKVASGRVNTWDAQVSYLSFRYRYLTITPKVNLLTNLGFGPDSNFTKNTNSPIARIKRFDMDADLAHPDSKDHVVNRSYDIGRNKLEGLGDAFCLKVIKRLREQFL